MKHRFFSWLRRRNFAKRITNLRTFLKAPEKRIGSVPKNVKVLVLAPHPDDESIGCGGTLSQLNANGSTFDVAFLTDGSAGGKLEHYLR